MYINNLSHMTKMATMPIYGKNPSNIFFSDFNESWREASEKRKRPKGFICPCTGVKYHNIQTCLLVYAADSGERLHRTIGPLVLSIREICPSYQLSLYKS